MEAGVKRDSHSKTRGKSAVSKAIASESAVSRASIFRNGCNQAVRLPQKLKSAENPKDVRIRQQGDGVVPSSVRPDWDAFFGFDTAVPDGLRTSTMLRRSGAV
jgi:virulence-associated protein VagC